MSEITKDENKFFSELIRVLFGSWYSIVGHTIIFLFIIIVWKDMLLFTTIVSIEAIYISIFILMAEYKEEKYREHREHIVRMEDRRLVMEDVDLTQHVISEITEIKKHQRQIAKSFQEIKGALGPS